MARRLMCAGPIAARLLFDVPARPVAGSPSSEEVICTSRETALRPVAEQANARILHGCRAFRVDLSTDPVVGGSRRAASTSRVQ
jgi:hypothetical protein